MDNLLDDNVIPADLRKFEQEYNQQLSVGVVTKETQFCYAVCLVRSKYAGDIKKGIILLEELYKKFTDDRRDYLYYMAIGHGRVKDYTRALKLCRDFLQFEPGNMQVLTLEKDIQQKLESEGKKGMILAGTGVLGVGALVLIGAALAAKRN